MEEGSEELEINCYEPKSAAQGTFLRAADTAENPAKGCDFPLPFLDPRAGDITWLLPALFPVSFCSPLLP